MNGVGPAPEKVIYHFLRKGRIVSQILSVLLFFFLFIKTDYTGSDSLEYAVNILFRIDPLLALSAILALKTFIALVFPALFVVALSLVFGRGFCGWFCPMGGLLDLWHKIFGDGGKNRATKFPDLAKILLIFILASALLGLPLAGYFDPFSILVRGLSQAVYPGFNDVSVSFFTFTYQHAPEMINRITEQLYAFLQYTVLPLDQKFFKFGLISLFVLCLIFVAEYIQHRFFCRNICPLGALLGWFAKLGLLKLDGGSDGCGKCRHCRTVCRMGAIDEDRQIDIKSCILCMDCFQQCPQQIISFAAALPVSRGVDISLSRRHFLATVSASVILPSVLGTRTLTFKPDPLLIRPPGALVETEFLQLCVRCGQCMQVCITNGLQPVLLKAGIEGMFSPHLVARTGYCEFNCTLCGQVCPIGALERLTMAQKHRFKIDHAWFEKNLCLSFAKAIPCIVCEEHCPTRDKAIKFESVTIVDPDGSKQRIKQPYVVDDLCIGCGICETKCPLPGRSAIFITSDGEVRNPDKRLPSEHGFDRYGG